VITGPVGGQTALASARSGPAELNSLDHVVAAVPAGWLAIICRTRSRVVILGDQITDVRRRAQHAPLTARELSARSLSSASTATWMR
jgi:hypothetical protein